MASLLELKGIKKSFDGIYALKGVSFSVYQNECLALVGENGAGKSTLMKVLSGVWPTGTFEGEIYWEGEKVEFSNPLDARKAGISIIHQELCLFPKLTVAENLFLTEKFPYEGEPSQNLWSAVDWNALNRRARRLLDELGFSVPEKEFVEDLSVAERQLVEIARAFHHKAKLLILDEPTSALSKAEIAQLFSVIERMQSKLSFIYISHKLDEVFRLSKRIIVLRDGESVAKFSTEATNSNEVIRAMVGRPLRENHETRKLHSEKNVLEVSNLSHTDLSGKKLIEGIGFELREGEILGVCGLMGSGRSELLRSLLGILPGNRVGQIKYQGKEVYWRDVSEAMEAGVAFVPEDRKKDGLFLEHSIGFNTSLSILEDLLTPWKQMDLLKEKETVKDLTKKMKVKYSDADLPVKVLSGGNQQKVLLSRVVAFAPKLIFLDEPTRGIDVGAKEEIYEILHGLVAEGISILLVSSELPEVLSLADRILVLREGQAMGLLPNENLTQEKVMAYAAGALHGIC